MSTPLQRAERCAGGVRRVTPGLAVLVLVAAVALGHWAGLQAVAERTPDARRTVATILDTGPVAYPDDNAVVPGPSEVRAVWTAPDGHNRVGMLTGTGRPETGGTRTIWTDSRGRPIHPPADGAVEALTAGLLVLAGGTALAGATVFAGARLTRERRRALAAEWAAVEPGWSGRDGSTR